MLGNWSLGDYFKKDAITYSFEFLTKVLNIPVERLGVTVFAGNDTIPFDEESKSIWLSLGIPEERIAATSEDNFGLLERLDHVDRTQRCFTGEVMMRFQKFLILKTRDGLKFGMMFLCNMRRKQMELL